MEVWNVEAMKTPRDLVLRAAGEKVSLSRELNREDESLVAIDILSFDDRRRREISRR